MRLAAPLVRLAGAVACGAVAVAAVVALLAASIAVVAVPAVTAGVTPPDLAAASRPASMATSLVAADGSLLATFRPEELHAPISPGAIPPNVRAAVIAAEDEAFERHAGVDVRAVIRALIANASSGRVEQGGSTITQQLVKNLFTTGEDTVARKVREARLAFAVESRYTKDEILNAYLNTAYFGEGAVGVGAAARTYFRKPANELTLSEASLLASVIPAPSDYNPRVAPEQAERRRLHVLDRIEEAGLAAPSEVAEARGDKPVVHPPRTAPPRHPYFVDYVRRWLLASDVVTERQVFGGGLRIETTLDPGVQDAASRAAARLPAGGPEAAVVVLDHRTGAVKALVGGRDWSESNVNLALGRFGGGSGRQPGSAFKPFVLAALLEKGASPHDRVPAPRLYQPRDRSDPVRNYSGRGYGTVTLADAIRRSINTAYVIAAEQADPDRVASLARSAGLRVPEDVGTSVALGAYEVSPLAMAQAFAAFARDGRRLEPTPVARIVAADGTVLFRAPKGDASDERVVSRDTARLVTESLTDVVNRGTGTRAQLDRPVAGKTGTTDDYTNAWFVGYTRTTAAAVWVGYREGNVPMRDVAGVAAVTGGSLPASIWQEVMAVATAPHPPGPFPEAPDRPRSTTTTTTGRTTVDPTTVTTGAPSTTATTATPTTAATTAEPKRTTTTTTAVPPPTTTTEQPVATQPTTTTTKPDRPGWGRGKGGGDR